jgi:hypothetical protein
MKFVWLRGRNRDGIYIRPRPSFSAHEPVGVPTFGVASAARRIRATRQAHGASTPSNGIEQDPVLNNAVTVRIMMDMVMLLVLAAAFAGAICYVGICLRLIQPAHSSTDRTK